MRTLHAWTSLALGAVLICHLVLLWRWILAKIQSRATSTRVNSLLWGGIFATVLVMSFAFFSWRAMVSVRFIADQYPNATAYNIPVNTPAPIASICPDARPNETASRVQGFLEKRCSSCHGTQHAAGGVRLNSLAELVTASPQLIVPGKPQESQLLNFLKNLPPNLAYRIPHELSGAELALLAQWILLGAPIP